MAGYVYVHFIEETFTLLYIHFTHFKADIPKLEVLMLYDMNCPH